MRKSKPCWFALFMLLFAPIYLYSQTNWGEQFADAIITRYPSGINAMSGKGWEYTNGIVLRGMAEMYTKTAKPNYLNYIKSFVDTYIGSDGTTLKSNLAINLDKIQPGVLPLFLYQQTHENKYRTAADTIRRYMKSLPRNILGGFWHKSNYPYQMWLDGLYMGEPFLSQYGFQINDSATCNAETTLQLLLINQHTYNPTAQLLYHGWWYDPEEKSTQPAWADTITGLSPEVWSRAMGWYAMALVDVMKYLPPTHHRFDSVLHVLNRVASGLKTWQDTSSGLWFQVMNKGTYSDNWLESSGSGMFIYALQTAVNHGWIDTSYQAVTRKGWTGLKTMFATYTDGLPQIKQFAAGMSIQTSYSKYVASSLKVNCPGSSNTHGYCATMLAAAAMEYTPKKQYWLTWSADSGSVTSSSADLYHPQGSTVTLTATPMDGYALDCWRGDTAATSSSLVIPIHSNKKVMAHFKKASYAVLTIRTEGQGTVDPDSGTIFLQGEKVTLTATPATGYMFAGWSGDTTSSSSSLDIIMNANKRVTAHFEKIPYAVLKISIDGQGTVTPDSGTLYMIGQKATLTALPKDGYEFEKWSGDTVATLANIELTMTNSKYVIAHFKELRYKLTVAITGAGNVTNAGTSYHRANEYLTLAATSNPGYQFDGWTGDTVAPDSTLIISMKTDRYYLASFSKKASPPAKYLLHISPSGLGCTVPTSDTSYVKGDTATLVAMPQSGYHFEKWIGDTTVLDSVFKWAITENKTIYAVFEPTPTGVFLHHFQPLSAKIEGTQMTVSGTSGIGKWIQIDIQTIHGKCIFQKRFVMQPQVSFALPEIPSGVYTLHLYSTTGTLSQKVYFP